VGVWTSTDPAEQFWSGYAYTLNPINNVDPDGRQVFSIEYGGKLGASCPDLETPGYYGALTYGKFWDLTGGHRKNPFLGYDFTTQEGGRIVGLAATHGFTLNFFTGNAKEYAGWADVVSIAFLVAEIQIFKAGTGWGFAVGFGPGIDIGIMKGRAYTDVPAFRDFSGTTNLQLDYNYSPEMIDQLTEQGIIPAEETVYINK